MKTSRRKFLAFLSPLPLLGLGAIFLKTKPVNLPPTPSCDDHDDPTPSQTEGPYFKPESPERSNLVEAEITGTKLILTGKVVNTNCQPVAKALLDWWHADDAGNYDNSGFRLRGHQYTDKQGNFRLETIVPGLYSGRTRHIHVKVRAPGKSILTTQLYFPNEPQNRRDRIYNEVLLLNLKPLGNKINADFTFVVAA